LVRRLRQRSGCARVVGTGHSSTGIVEAQDALISLRQYKGIVTVDRAHQRATVRAGTPLSELGEALYAHDLALPNLGDVATQTIGGAVGAGTHGTGRRLHNLSQMMICIAQDRPRGVRRPVIAGIFPLHQHSCGLAMAQ
jgi:FAD/FMN-containing dehydrogenase